MDGAPAHAIAMDAVTPGDKPNPDFKRGELPWIVREIMWGAGAPISVRTISLAALARKGVRSPGPGTMRHTRKSVRAILGRISLCPALDRHDVWNGSDMEEVRWGYREDQFRHHQDRGQHRA